MPSSATAKGQTPTSTAAAESKPQAPLQPVAPFTTPAARAISWGHPAVLIAACLARLPALIENPTSALESSLPFVVGLQILYVVVCLPVAGPQNARKAPRPGERRKNEPSGTNHFAAVVLSLILTAIVTPALHMVLVLFGAPFLNHVSDTLLCAAHLAALSIFPIFYTRAVDTQALTAMAGVFAPMDEVFGGLVGAGLGAWLGAVPIPLDWDRPWQRWPVTIVVGMYIGYVIGAKGLGTLFYGKRLAGEMVEEDGDQE